MGTSLKGINVLPSTSERLLILVSKIIQKEPTAPTTIPPNTILFLGDTGILFALATSITLALGL
jgi:hypothetical protein